LIDGAKIDVFRVEVNQLSKTTVSDVPVRGTVSISQVELETGLSKDTLRVWERRYGFPTPARDGNDERVYSEEQVERLRVIRRLLDSGHRPGKIVHLPLCELTSVAAPKTRRARAGVDPQDSTQRALQMIVEHRAEELRDYLIHLLMQLGLRRFILEVVVPLNWLVGDAWLRGSIQIFEEHLYTNQVQALLQHALAALPAPGKPPRILLTTLPGEEHQLGMLMAHAFFAMDGAQCLSLGTQTPIADILSAVEAHSIDVVGLSCTAIPSRVPHAQLSTLREKLRREVDLWVGGTAALLDPRLLVGIQRMASLTDIPMALSEWRVRHNLKYND
jgi:DNA-binding transcriptional MerR regulator/methylmalonyl-CoA mutase cobalamin-binding subunit